MTRWVHGTAALFFLVAASGGPRAGAEPAARASLAAGLLVHWKVDETVTTGNALDSTGGGHDAGYANGPITPSTTVAPLTYSNPRSVDLVQASRQYLFVADSPALTLAGPFSFSVWVRPTDTPEQQGIIEKWDDGGALGAVNGYFLRLNSLEHVTWSLFGAAGQIVSGMSGSPVDTAGAWTHLALVYNGSTVTLYVNGAPDGSQPNSTPPGDGAGELHIGADYGINAFNGNIDDVRIYDRELTLSEVQTLAAGNDVGGTTPPPPPPPGPPPPPAGPDTRDNSNGNDFINDRCGCSVAPESPWLAGVILGVIFAVRPRRK